MDSEEQALERSIATLESLKAQIANIQQQLSALELSIQEHKKAIETIEGYRNMGDDEILIPIGAGVLISAKVSGKKGLISIGNALYTEMNIEEIAKKLKERMEDLEKLKTKLMEDSYRLQENYALLSAKVEEDYRKYIEERRNVQTP
ncbi:MAG: prefoldin subunit alpha [Euryarchaeota archaeon]|nr:prefoldin subunit alpha [Euryarchaeota archaeon]